MDNLETSPWKLNNGGKVIITPLLQEQLRSGKFLVPSVDYSKVEDPEYMGKLLNYYKERNKEIREELISHIFNGNIEYSGIPLHNRYGIILASKLVSSNGSLFYETKGSNKTNRLLVTANQLTNCYFIRFNPETDKYEPSLFESDDVFNTHITVGLNIQNPSDKTELETRCKNSFSMYFLVEGIASLTDLTLISQDGVEAPSIIYNGIPIFSMGINGPIEPPKSSISLTGIELTKHLSSISRTQALKAKNRAVGKEDSIPLYPNLPNEGVGSIQDLLGYNKELPGSKPIELSPKPLPTPINDEDITLDT